MKIPFKLFLSFLILIASISSKAQLVQKIDDAKKLEISEKQFLDKPLKTLLNEIKPQIKRVLVSPGGGEINSFFVFYFVNDEEYYNFRKENKSPISIRVYTKEIINWGLPDKAKNDWRKWNENDAENYGNLTIRAIRVSGKD